MATRKIVVAGATGMIGRHVVTALARRGDGVVTLVRNVDRARRAFGAEVDVVRWNAADDSGDWTRAIDGAHAVVNLSGSQMITRWTREKWRQIRESRIDATHHFVDAIGAAGTRPKVLVNMSGTGYYGLCPSGPVAESSPPGEDTIARLCVDWEAEARRVTDFGVRVVILRTSPVLATEGGAMSPLLRAFRLFVGGPLGSGRQAFPWIHVDDQVGMILWAVDNPAVHGPVNAVAPEMVSNREFSRALGKVLQRPSFLRAPRFAVRLLYGEAAEAVLGGQKAVPAKAMELGFRFRHPRLDEALRDLLC